MMSNENKYAILDEYRKVMGMDWPEFYKTLGLNMSASTLYKAATGENKHGPRPLYAAVLDRWIFRNKEKIEAALGRSLEPVEAEK
jgi:hypothetical protein